MHNPHYRHYPLLSDLVSPQNELINRYSGKALDVAKVSTADGANVQQWNYGGGDNQQWQLVAVGSNARTADVKAKSMQHVEAGLLQLYPNPTTGVVQLRGEVTEPVRVYSLQGKLMLRSQLNQQQEIDVSALPTGVYMIEVQGQGQPFRARIIKE